MKVTKWYWLTFMSFVLVLRATNLVTTDTMWICLFIAVLGLQLLQSKEAS